jgi:hypothetical protein
VRKFTHLLFSGLSFSSLLSAEFIFGEKQLLANLSLKTFDPFRTSYTRLVMTPLTERCYRILLMALDLGSIL